jgi:glutamate dehydrogenase
MMLSAEEFMEIKEELVGQVLDNLRRLAKVEAELMFREYKLDPNSALPPVSSRISDAITKVHDSVSAALEHMSDAERNDVLETLISEHLPPILLEKAGPGAVLERIPAPYLREVVACVLASKIVYREGINFIEGLPEASLANLGFKYLRQEQRVQDLASTLEGTEMPDDQKKEIIDLLFRGGIRAGVEQSKE